MVSSPWRIDAEGVGLAEKTGQDWRFADYLVSRPFIEVEEVTLCQR